MPVAPTLRGVKEGRDEVLERALAEQPMVEKVRRDRQGVVFDHTGSGEDLSKLLGALVAQGLQPVEFAAQEANLEEVFLTLTEGKLQ